VLYVEHQIISPDAPDWRFLDHIAWIYAQKGPIARKDLGFLPRRTVLYVEAKIFYHEDADERVLLI